jgi:ABC-2 type transport system permease protein
MIAALYVVVLRSQATRGRLLALGALGVLIVLLGLAIGASDTTTIDNATGFINTIGLTIMVPLSALALGSAALGDLVEDGTLVYLWLRPVARWKLVVAAALATISVTAPLVVVPLVLGAAATGQGTDLILGTALAAVLGVIAYSGIFVMLGLWVRRALVWGAVYIFIWEGFVARAGRSASRLAVAAYTRSVLSRATGVTLRLAEISPFFAVVVPIVVGIAALAAAAWRMQHQDVA